MYKTTMDHELSKFILAADGESVVRTTLVDAAGDGIDISNGAIPVTTTEKDTYTFSHKFMARTVADREKLITAQTGYQGYTFTMATAQASWIGKTINVAELYVFQQFTIINVVGTTVTVDAPIDYPYSTNADVDIGITNMNVDGSTTPVFFSMRPPVGTVWNATIFSFGLLSSAKMDDGLFAGISALTRGCLARGIGPAGALTSGNYKTNFDILIKTEGYYSQPSGVAPYGLTGRLISKDLGATTIIDSDTHTGLLIQDDLTASSLLLFEGMGRGFMKSYTP